MPLLNIRLSSQFAVGYAECYMWAYFNSYTKFQIPNAIGMCHFTISSEQFRYEEELKRNKGI